MLAKSPDKRYYWGSFGICIFPLLPQYLMDIQFSNFALGSRCGFCLGVADIYLQGYQMCILPRVAEMYFPHGYACEHISSIRQFCLCLTLEVVMAILKCDYNWIPLQFCLWPCRVCHRYIKCLFGGLSGCKIKIYDEMKPKDVDAVARLESFRAPKLSKPESFRGLKF